MTEIERLGGTRGLRLCAHIFVSVVLKIETHGAKMDHHGWWWRFQLSSPEAGIARVTVARGTHVLVLLSPAQSWGTNSRFHNRT